MAIVVPALPCQHGLQTWSAVSLQLCQNLNSAKALQVACSVCMTLWACQAEVEAHLADGCHCLSHENQSGLKINIKQILMFLILSVAGFLISTNHEVSPVTQPTT
jgi:hypothetical protein